MSATKYAGSDAIFKVRCSAGVQVKSFLPKSYQSGVIIDDSLSDSPELEMSCVTPDTNIAVELSHRIGGIKNDLSSVNENPMVYFQTALLYTSTSGRRRLRVTTLGLRSTKSASDAFRTSDFGVVSSI